MASAHGRAPAITGGRFAGNIARHEGAHAGRQRQPDRVAGAGRHLDGLPFGVFHPRDVGVRIAARPDQLEPIADGELVLDPDLRQTARASKSDHVADVLAAPGLGIATQVVLRLLRRVALVEARGVAAVGQAFELADQGRVQRRPATASSMAWR